MNNSDIIAFMTCLFTSQCIKLFSIVWNCFFQTKIDTYRKLHDQIDKEETQQLLSITDTNSKLIHILSTEWEPNNADSTTVLCKSVLLRPCTPIFSLRLILKCISLLEVNRKHHSSWKLVHAMCERMIVCNNTQDSELNKVIRLMSTDIVSFVNVILPSGVLPYEINEKITIPPNISRLDWNRIKNRILESVLYSFKEQFQAMRKKTEPHSLDWDILEYVVQILLKLHHHDPTNGLIQFPLKLQFLLFSYSDHRYDFRSFQMDQIHSFVQNRFPPILLQDEPKPGINLSGFFIEWKQNGNI